MAEMDRHKLGLNFRNAGGAQHLKAIYHCRQAKKAKIKCCSSLPLDQEAFGLSTNFGLNVAGFFPMKKWPTFQKSFNPMMPSLKHHLEDEGQNILPAISRLIGAARNSKQECISPTLSLWAKFLELFFQSFGDGEIARKEGVKNNLRFFPYTKTGKPF